MPFLNLKIEHPTHESIKIGRADQGFQYAVVRNNEYIVAAVVSKETANMLADRLSSLYSFSYTVREIYN